jgi:mRNA-degrading endonuclease RelE of RelBE toxin-antitoxin system
VKFQTTPAFDRDFKRLPRQHQKKFRELVPAFNTAVERAASGQDQPWPKSMRVKPIKSATGVWELTWSMNDPDGRATWEWTDVDGEPAIRWRRIGDYRVLDTG